MSGLKRIQKGEKKSVEDFVTSIALTYLGFLMQCALFMLDLSRIANFNGPTIPLPDKLHM